jgi:hypothetical protein
LLQPLKKDAGNDLKKAGVPEWYADFVEKNKRWEVIFKLIKVCVRRATCRATFLGTGFRRRPPSL